MRAKGAGTSEQKLHFPYWKLHVCMRTLHWGPNSLIGKLHVCMKTLHWGSFHKIFTKTHVPATLMIYSSSQVELQHTSIQSYHGKEVQNAKLPHPSYKRLFLDLKSLLLNQRKTESNKI